MYQTNTLVTVAKDHIKIWDLKDLFAKTAQTGKFKIKPGYEAIEKHSMAAKY